MRARLLLVTGLAAVVLSGCALGAQRHPDTVDRARVPFGLLERERPASSEVSSAPSGAVFLVDADGTLLPVPRFDIATGLDGALKALGAPVSDDERERGLRSPLSEDDDDLLVDGSVDNGIAVIRLAPTFADLDTKTQRLAIAQVVLTLTSLPGVGQVAITADGGAISVPVADGSTKSGPVSKEDFIDLVAS